MSPPPSLRGLLTRLANAAFALSFDATSRPCAAASSVVAVASLLPGPCTAANPTADSLTTDPPHRSESKFGSTLAHCSGDSSIFPPHSLTMANTHQRTHCRGVDPIMHAAASGRGLGAEESDFLVHVGH